MALRPITPNDYAMLQSLEMSTELEARWRLRGSTPSPDQWSQGFWSQVLAQFLVVSTREERPLGIVAVYQPSMKDGHARFAAARFPPVTRSPTMMLGIGLFLNYVFSHWPFRRLYLETPVYNLEQFTAGQGKLFTEEARLRDYYYLNGRYWDQVTLQITRESWEARAERVLTAERRPTRRVTLSLPGAGGLDA